MRAFCLAVTVGLFAVVVAALEKVLLLHDGSTPESLIEYLSKSTSSFTPTIAPSSEFKGQLIDLITDALRFEHIILSGGRLPKSLKNEEIVEFVKRGGNFLWVLPSKLKTLDVRTRGLALEFGRVFDAQPARILDYSSSTTKPELVPVRIASEIADRVFTSKNIAATFNGWSHRLDPDNPLVFPLLTALPVAVGQCPDKVGLDRCIPPYGADNVIASALQTRVDSRVTIVSGNHWFQTMNQPGEELLMWTFQKSGQLRVDSYTHRNLEGRNDGRGYRIGDHVELRICLSTGKLGGWESTQPKDMQMELTMLDAWLRADLLPTSDGCLSTGPVKLPDRYGTYSLKVRYQRRGWPHLIKREIFIVRPFHHDEAQRHVTAALPYYLAWFGMMISSAFFVFPLIFPVKKDY